MITPPHTISSINHAVSIYEGDRAITRAKVFIDVLSEHPIPGDDYISLLMRDGPGSRLAQPIAIVYIDDQDNPTTPLQKNDCSVKIPAQYECFPLDTPLAPPGAPLHENGPTPAPDKSHLRDESSLIPVPGFGNPVVHPQPQQLPEGKFYAEIKAQKPWRKWL
jgi:hypothetical protein